MITRLESNNNKINFRAVKPITIGNKAQSMLTKIENFSSVQQRLAIGGTALLIQPVIDLSNKEVDKDTRWVSAIRSGAKAIVGTATGILVRGACMKATELKLAKRDATGKVIKEAGKITVDPNKINKLLGNSFDSLKLSPKELSDAINRVPSVIGTLVALGAMIITNFALDAPLTNKSAELVEKFANEHSKKSGGTQNG